MASAEDGSVSRESVSREAKELSILKRVKQKVRHMRMRESFTSIKKYELARLPVVEQFNKKN